MATRYRRDKQKLQIEGHTIQWPKDTDEIHEATNRRSGNTMANRSRQDKQKQQIEGQTIQWPNDTDKINRNYKLKVRQYNGHKIPTR
jgi:hypothetical protein